jgi:hypothetical protein
MRTIQKEAEHFKSDQPNSFLPSLSDWDNFQVAGSATGLDTRSEKFWRHSKKPRT